MLHIPALTRLESIRRFLESFSVNYRKLVQSTDDRYASALSSVVLARSSRIPSANDRHRYGRNICNGICVDAYGVEFLGSPIQYAKLNSAHGVTEMLNNSCRLSVNRARSASPEFHDSCSIAEHDDKIQTNQDTAA